MPFDYGPGEIQSATLIVRVLVAQMKTTITAIGGLTGTSKRCARRIKTTSLFAALLGVGTVYVARLRAGLGSVRNRWTTADELLRFSGVAPVVERSGKQYWVRWHYFCPKFFRQSFHEYAGEPIQHSFGSELTTLAARERKSHHAAVQTGMQFATIRWTSSASTSEWVHKGVVTRE